MSANIIIDQFLKVNMRDKEIIYHSAKINCKLQDKLMSDWNAEAEECSKDRFKSMEINIFSQK